MRWLLLFLIPLNSFAAEPAKAPAERPFHLDAGVKLSLVKERRGTRLYDGFDFSPIINFSFFENHLLVQYPSITVQGWAFPFLRIHSGFDYFYDKPLIRTSGPLDIRNTHQDSIEWSLAVDLYGPNVENYWISLELLFAKGVSGHQGEYYQASPRISLGRYAHEHQEHDQPAWLVQPQIFGNIGIGDKRHNVYQYGAIGHDTEPCFIEAGLLFNSPARWDPHFPVVQIYYYKIIGTESSVGSLVGEATHGIQITFSLAHGIL